MSTYIGSSIPKVPKPRDLNSLAIYYLYIIYCTYLPIYFELSLDHLYYLIKCKLYVLVVELYCLRKTETNTLHVSPNVNFQICLNIIYEVYTK